MEVKIVRSSTEIVRASGGFKHGSDISKKSGWKLYVRKRGGRDSAKI